MKFFPVYKKTEKKKAVRLPLSAYLSYLLVATLLFTGVSFSKFATSSSGWDSARVAQFSVTTAVADGQKQELDLDLSTAAETKSDHYTFTVKNDSEVRVAYTVTVTLPSETKLPTGVSMTMTMVDGEDSSVMAATESGGVYTYNSELDFTDSHQWTLTFIGNPTAVTDNMILEGITVAVAAEQID